ncbi:DUF6622 family protein [Ideonella sp.]|uniref:DUF6622 family protein n=1 Tax=Ideonella sp. TaxID=1929293 RepID=UPI0035B1B32E
MLSHVPAWVYGVLLALLALGLLFSRPRAVRPVVPALTALGFGAYSLYGVISSFGASPGSLVPWALGLVASMVGSRPWVGPVGMSRVPGSSRVLVPGSWLPLALMMGIFALKFFVGIVHGARLPLGALAGFGPAVSLVLGLCSGVFMARALNVRRFVQVRSP